MRLLAGDAESSAPDLIGTSVVIRIMQAMNLAAMSEGFIPGLFSRVINLVTGVWGVPCPEDWTQSPSPG